MWVFTTIGFFSIVAHRTMPGHVCVRARSIDDLSSFVSRLPLPRPKIRRTPQADYLFRVIASKIEVAKLIEHLAECIDYDNFKNAVAARQGHDRAALYHDVWNAVHPLQYDPSNAKGGAKWPP